MRECEGARVTAILVWGLRRCGSVFVMSTGHVSCTWDSVILSSATDVLGMSVLRGMRVVGGVCEMCMCLALRGVGGEGCVEERIWFGF